MGAYLLRLALLFLGMMLLRRWLRIRRFPAQQPRSTSTKSPYEVLGVSRSATQEEIRAAYKRALSEYHPDKVAQLGQDLQKVAKEKTAEIIEAYRLLNRG